MEPHGVAIFYRDNPAGQDQPVHFVWGTDPKSLDRAWEETMDILGAVDPEELRREGYFARLVSLAPLVEEDLDQRGFIESCLKLVQVEVEGGDCTSHAGNELVTETLLEARLTGDTIRVPLPRHQPALPEFAADYLDCRDAGDIELPLYFILKERTATHAVYAVQEWDRLPAAARGKMSRSGRTLWQPARLRRLG